MKKIFTSVWMTIIVSAVVYMGATVAFWKTPTPVAARTEDEKAAEPKMMAPSWDFINPEADQMMTELRAEKKDLDKRSQQLHELQVRLDAERAELNTVTQAVHQMQIDFDKGVVRIKEEETANLKKLGKVYSSMAPDSASTIMGELDDTTIVKIMVFMKDPETAAILESLAKKTPADARRAANISERLRLTAFRDAATAAK